MFEILQDNRDIVGWVLIGILVVIIAITAWCIYSKTKDKSKFTNDESKNDANMLIEKPSTEKPSTEKPPEDDEVIFIDRIGCPYSDKQRKSIEDNGNTIGEFKVRIVQIGCEEGQEISRKFNIRGTPTLLNVRNNAISVGAKPDEEHIMALKNIKKVIDVELDPNVLYVVGRDGCPFCVKMYKLLDDNGITYEKITSNSENGRKILEKYEASGVPLLVKNDNSMIGYNEIDAIRETFKV